MHETPPEAPQAGPTPHGWHADVDIWYCEKAYQFKNVRGVDVPRVEVAEAHAVGLCFHAGRARWFSQIKAGTKLDWGSITQAVQAEVEAQKLPVSFKAERKALDLLELYIDHYSTRPAPQVVAAEYLVGPAPTYPGSEEMHTARLDDVSRYPEGGNALWIGESKTTSASPSEVIKYYEANAGQLLKQRLLWKLAPEGERTHGPVAGIMLDIVKKPYGNKPAAFQRHAISIEDYALDWFADNLEDRRQRRKQINWNAKVRRNPTACTRVVAGGIVVQCPYLDLCRYGRSAASKYLVGNVPMPLWEAGPNQEVEPWR